jgi:hypothetical protein
VHPPLSILQSPIHIHIHPPQKGFQPQNGAKPRRWGFSFRRGGCKVPYVAHFFPFPNLKDLRFIPNVLKDNESGASSGEYDSSCPSSDA